MTHNVEKLLQETENVKFNCEQTFAGSQERGGSWLWENRDRIISSLRTLHALLTCPAFKGVMEKTHAVVKVVPENGVICNAQMACKNEAEAIRKAVASDAG